MLFFNKKIFISIILFFIFSFSSFGYKNNHLYVGLGADYCYRQFNNGKSFSPTMNITFDIFGFNYILSGNSHRKNETNVGIWYENYYISNLFGYDIPMDNKKIIVTPLIGFTKYWESKINGDNWRIDSYTGGIINETTEIYNKRYFDYGVSFKYNITNREDMFPMIYFNVTKFNMSLGFIFLFNF